MFALYVCIVLMLHSELIKSTFYQEKKNKMLKKQKKKQAKQQELEAEKTEAQPEEVEMPVAQVLCIPARKQQHLPIQGS